MILEKKMADEMTEEACEDKEYDERCSLLQKEIDELVMKHSGQIPTHEIIFALVMTASEIAYTCAPSHKIAHETIKAGIKTGFEISLDDSIEKGTLH